MTTPKICKAPDARTLTRKIVLRICPFCGEEGMILSMGGYGGMVYKCTNCQYTGPLVIESEPEDNPERETRAYSVSRARLNRTLNLAGLIFGITFLATGAVVGFSPLPLSGGESVGSYGLGVFVLGAMLVVVSGLFWLAERPKSIDRSSSGR